MAYSETRQNRYDRFLEEWATDLPQDEAYELANFLAGFARDRAVGKRPPLWEFEGPEPTKANVSEEFYARYQEPKEEPTTVFES